MSGLGQILIVTEMGSKIGTGHVMRCRALSQAFEEKGMGVNWLIAENELYHKKIYQEAISKHKIIIFDSYLMSDELYYSLSSSDEKLFVHVDDNIQRNYQSGILINGTVGAKNFVTVHNNQIRYLLGPEYIPIRKAFWNIPIRTTNKKITSILVTFGGDDVRGMTPKIVDWLLKNADKSVSINVIVGSQFSDKSAQINVNQNHRINIWHDASEFQMRDLMLSSDIAISAGGQTLYELASTGTPTIVVKVADNQSKNILGFQQKNFIEYIGEWNMHYLQVNLHRALEKLLNSENREKINKIGRSIVDGQGALRIATLISEGMNENSFFDK